MEMRGTKNRGRGLWLGLIALCLKYYCFDSFLMKALAQHFALKPAVNHIQRLKLRENKVYFLSIFSQNLLKPTDFSSYFEYYVLYTI